MTAPAVGLLPRRLHRYQAALSRDAYLAALITAALDQASDPPPYCAPPWAPRPTGYHLHARLPTAQ